MRVYPPFTPGRMASASKKRGLLVEEAYDEVGERRKEWYDIRYWFDLFQLGDYRRVLETYRHRALPYPETLQVLSTLGRAYTLIISSSSAREFLPYLLDGIDRYFARVFSSISDYGQLKNPEFYLTVCREMGVEPGQMVHVGDSWQFDFLAAKEIGIKVFHIDRGQEHQARRVIKKPHGPECRTPWRLEAGHGHQRPENAAALTSWRFYHSVLGRTVGGTRHNKDGGYSNDHNQG